jgi:hypothetical protein
VSDEHLDPGVCDGVVHQRGDRGRRVSVTLLGGCDGISDLGLAWGAEAASEITDDDAVR